MENVRHHASQHVRLLAQLVTRAARISKNLIISNDERVFFWSVSIIRTPIHSLVLRRRRK